MSTTKIHPHDLAKGQKHLSSARKQAPLEAKQRGFVCKREKPIGKKHLYELPVIKFHVSFFGAPFAIFQDKVLQVNGGWKNMGLKRN